MTTTKIPTSNISNDVRELAKRMGDVEEDIYGDQRKQLPGIMAEVRQNTKQLERQTMIVWGLIVVSVLNMATVALAVLVP